MDLRRNRRGWCATVASSLVVAAGCSTSGKFALHAPGDGPVPPWQPSAGAPATSHVQAPKSAELGLPSQVASPRPPPAPSPGAYTAAELKALAGPFAPPAASRPCGFG